jgi:hypothetical protein
MSALLNFFNENATYVAIVIAVVFILLVYINFFDIDLNKPTNKKLTQTVVVETFGNRETYVNRETNDIDKLYQASTNTGTGDSTQDFALDGAKSFCENHRGKSGDLNASCKLLTTDNCKSSSCCVLVQGQNGNTCMAGDVNGPTFKKDKDGNMISMDAYYFQGKNYPTPTSV